MNELQLMADAVTQLIAQSKTHQDISLGLLELAGRFTSTLARQDAELKSLRARVEALETMGGP